MNDFCTHGTPKLQDDCQTALGNASQSIGFAIDAMIKAQAAADPVSEHVTRQALDKLQDAYGLIVQLHGARNAHHASSAQH